MKNKDLNISFEEAMQRLEDAAMCLEGSNLTLDDSISEFEKAIELIKICENKLLLAKQKVRILTESEDGTISDKPFLGGDDDAS